MNKKNYQTKIDEQETRTCHIIQWKQLWWKQAVCGHNGGTDLWNKQQRVKW